MNKNTCLYGNWDSAITPALIVSDSLSLDEPRLSANALYYIERRPQENGRCVIVQVTGKDRIDLLPPPYSARSRVHEYGGGAYYVAAKAGRDTVYFVNDADQDIYRVFEGNIERLTTAAHRRFADFISDDKNQRLIAVCEEHHEQKVINTLVSIDIDSGEITSLQQGEDFYASPRISPDSRWLCWQSWNHPNMPWDSNRLWLAEISASGELSSPVTIAGGDGISTFQPQWSPDGWLYYVSDDDGWWHIYRCHVETGASNEKLTSGEKEFGLPQWVFAQSTFAFLDQHTLVCSYQDSGRNILATLDLRQTAENREPRPVGNRWQSFDGICARDGRLCFIGAAPDCFPQLVDARLQPPGKAQTPTGQAAGQTARQNLDGHIVQSPSKLPVADEYYARAEPVCFNNRHGQTVYANYYPPTHPEHRPDTNQAPPLIVICHGGPTGQSSLALDPRKLFWTSRGFALLDVNYSGSTGYGREYRERLQGKWGVLDVQDCCDAALHAVEQGLADKERLIIRGSSAGGFTVLAALTFEQVFSAGASYYGISDLCTLATDTHKFEARYLDRLVGPWPEQKTLYEQRSPINHSDQLNCPVIFFQGLEDKVVPKEQAEAMFRVLADKGLPVAAQYYPGEQHGFRQAETIMQSLENELAFYQWVLDLKDKDQIHFSGAIEVKNLGTSD
ncbi:MAG TPA: S9 family peptidase [Gammaproteobacteria bacterium]|nr:S9 family peptidase [Gammaproteobacteria bacterium]